MTFFHNSTSASPALKRLARTLHEIHKKPCFCYCYITAVIPIAKIAKLAILDSASFILVFLPSLEKDILYKLKST